MIVGVLTTLLAGTAACGGSRGGPDVKPPDMVELPDITPAAVPDEVVTPISEADGTLIGPHFELKFSRSVVSKTTFGVTDSHGHSDNRAHPAAKGHEFIRLKGEGLNVYDPTKTALTVVVDGAERPVPKYALTYGIVVSVPVGHTALLKVVDDGRAQSFDMRAGKRGADAVVGFYPRRALAWPESSGDNPDYYDSRATCNAPDLYGTASKDLCKVDVGFSVFGAVRLEPWLPILGWARPGRIWVATTIFTEFHPPSAVTFTIDPAKTFTLTLPDGTIVPGRIAEGADHMVGATYGTTLTFDVPDTISAGVVTIQAVGTFSPASVTWAKAPPAQKYALAVK